MLKDVDQSQLKAVICLLQTYLLYATVALIVIIAISAILTKIFAPNKIESFAKIMLCIAVGFAVGVIFCIGSLQIARMVLKDEITYVFWMGVALVLALAVILVTGACIKAKMPNAFNLFAIISAVVIAAYVIVFLVVLPKTESDYKPESPIIYYVLTAVLVAIMSGIILIFGKKQGKTHSTRSITYAAVCIALSYAFSYIKFFSMPQGGSITFASLLPLMIYAYMFGVRKGVACGIVYGLMQFLQSPQAYEPIQILIDYPIAFGFIGIAGTFRGMFGKSNAHRLLEFSVGATVAVLFRYFSHILSGACVFYSWMPDTYTNPWIYSIAYNSYVLVDLAIALFAGIFILLSNAFNRKMDQVMLYGINEEDQ